MSDHYQTLGVARDATPDEIKKAYRKLAAIHHPDKGGDTATFQKVQAAYEILSDPQKKQEYDSPRQQFGGSGFPGGFSFHTQGFDINDIIGQMFGGGGGPFHNPFQQNFRTTIWVTLEQVYSGSEQMLQMQGPNGVQVVKIQIPKGVENGQTMRFDNIIQGAILLVDFRIHPHAKFTRIGQDLQVTQRISVLDLLAGTSFEVTTISGKTFTVAVKPGTQPDATLKVAGQGLPIQNSTQFGDQLILLKPFIPDKIDDRIIDSIKQFKGN
jgi:DnaJ-class molecular chaperone